MNKSKIEWCDYTWNPVTGCLHGCDYCYAARIDKRFGDGKFTPTFHHNRLSEPLKVKKPSRIFVGSVSDLFGNWDWKLGNGALPSHSVIGEVLDIAELCPEHTFIFLTKNPKGMQGFDFTDNCWCGTSIENQEKADERLPELKKVKCKTLFASYEPALGKVDFEPMRYTIDWLIIGSQTGPGAIKPKRDWLLIADHAQAANIPVFIKDNAADFYGGELLPRDYPDAAK